jgi:hypothetical protein
MTVTLDDVSCLLHLPVEGMLLSYESVPKADVVQLMMELLRVDAGEAWNEVEKTRLTFSISILEGIFQGASSGGTRGLPCWSFG